jgi:hypothetical protein
MHATLIELEKIRPFESMLEEVFHDEAIIGTGEKGFMEGVNHRDPGVRQEAPGLGNPRTRRETTVTIVGVLKERSRYANLELHVLHASANELTCQSRASSVAQDSE